MTLLLTIALWLLTTTVFIVTVLSVTTSTRWWIRMWDFPRLHVLAVAVAAILLAMFIDGPILAVIILLGSAIYQGMKILPFTRLTRPEIPFEPRQMTPASACSPAMSKWRMPSTKKWPISSPAKARMSCC